MYKDSNILYLRKDIHGKHLQANQIHLEEKNIYQKYTLIVWRLPLPIECSRRGKVQTDETLAFSAAAHSCLLQITARIQK
jgi:hypothetical protein